MGTKTTINAFYSFAPVILTKGRSQPSKAGSANVRKIDGPENS